MYTGARLYKIYAFSLFLNHENQFAAFLYFFAFPFQKHNVKSNSSLRDYSVNRMKCYF